MANFSQQPSDPQIASATFFDTQILLGSAIGGALISSGFLQDKYAGIPLTKISAMGVTGDFPDSTQPVPITGQIWPRGLN